MPAVWIVALLFAAVSLVAIARVGAARSHRAVATAQPVVAKTPATTPTVDQNSRVRARLGTLPLAFEANQGQTDPQVKYMARGNGYTVFLTSNDTVFALQSSERAATQVSGKRGLGEVHPNPLAKANLASAIHMHLLGGSAQPQVAAGSELPGHSNYFIGNDRSQWHSNVAQFARVSYRDVYPGVNMAFYGVQKQLEFDFIVAPGASVAPIRLGVSGAKRVTTDDSGNLLLASSAGNVLLHKPVAYQLKDGARQPVDAHFVLQAHNQVALELGNYDRSRELVIDPSVSYSTYLGGTAEDDGYAIAVDGSGNAYVTGQTKSTDFPTANALHGSTAGGFNVFVTELSPTGSLVYSTYIGGTSDDSGNAIAVDGSGDAFVAGGTNSSDFPTQGAFQGLFGGVTDAFVLELNSTGSALTYSTFLGGTGSDVATGLAVDGDGNAYVAGSTTSVDFPKQNPIQAAIAGASNGFVTKLNSSGNALAYSTYLGGGTGDFAVGVAVDSSKNAYVTGGTKNKTFPTTTGAFQTSCGSDGNCNGGLYDAFVSVINPSGSGFVYSTFLGGESNDEGLAIDVDKSSGEAYVTGFTSSSSKFPLQSPLQGTFGGGTLPTDAFVTELNAAGSGLVYSTYLGGSGDDTGIGITVDANKNAYITGQTSSTNFPTASSTQSANGGGNDAFVTEIGAGGSALLFSTYLGGSLNEDTIGGGAVGAIAVDSAGAGIYVTGNTTSTNFPTQSPKQSTYGGGTDAFVTKYTQGTGASFTVANSALSPTSGVAGVSATATITVGSVNGFNSAVMLSCAVAPVASSGPTCGFSNPGNSVTPPANGTVTSTLTVSTTAASAMLDRPSNGHSSYALYATILPVFGIALLGAGMISAGTRRRKMFGFLMLGMVLTGLLFMPACSSGSGSKGGGTTGTPAGTYTITVTGSSGGATATGSPALSLTVN